MQKDDINMKKTLITILAIIYIMMTFFPALSPVFAENSKNAESSVSEEKDLSDNDDSNDDKKKKDKDKSEDKEDEEEEEFTPISKYLLIADVESSRILYEDDSDKEFNPGAMVKILTAITAIENCADLSKKIAPKMPILDGYDYDSHGNIGLTYGEKISIKNMLEAMMITDAGDCAITIAHNVGESYEEFIRLMNETAKKAGATESVFTDPAGFDKKHQKSTLADMAKITAYALKNKTFCSIASKENIEIPATNKRVSTRTIFNRNNYISRYYSLEYYNPNIKFAKSYYNSDEDCGMVAHYQTSSSNVLLLCAKSKFTYANRSYDDINYLIDYAGKKFKQVTLINEGEFVHEADIDNGYNADRVLLVSTTQVKVTLENNYESSKIEKKVKLNDDICAPIKKGQFLGMASVYYDGEKCADVKLVSYSDIEKSNITYLKNKIKSIADSGYFKLFVAIILLIFIYNVIKINRGKK